MFNHHDRAAHGIDLSYCQHHTCGVFSTRLDTCGYIRECRAEEIARLDAFLSESPEPLAGDFPFFTAEALCMLVSHKCGSCPMLIAGELAYSEDDDEFAEDEYCAFGFYEGRPDLVDPAEGNARKLDHEPDPEMLALIVELAKGEGHADR